MAKQSLNTGTLANDGTGDSLRSGATKINANFSELYTAIGNGSTTTVSTSNAQTGQVLRWNGSSFVPADYGSLTSTLDVNNYNIVSSNNGHIVLDPAGTGDVSLVYGGQTATFDGSTGEAQLSGKITYKNEWGTLGQAPAASNTGYFFTVNGDNNPKVNIGITGLGNVTANLLTNYSSINALSDVDTTIAPTNGQVLKWNSATSQWKPGDDSAGASTQNLFATVAGDTGSTTANSPTDTLTITGGTNCSTAVSGDTITVNVDGQFQLAELTDVNFTTLARGDSLTYDTQGGGVTAAWINQPSPTLWYVFSVGLNNNSYLIEGPGQVQTDDPDLHLYRGFTYVFINQAGPNHPLRIQSTTGLSGSPYTTGLTGSQTGRQYFTVPMNAPNTLYYQCTIHVNMGGILYIK